MARGRKPTYGERMDCHLDFRMTKAQRATLTAAGGPDWIRAKLDEEAKRQARTPSPHNPFPGARWLNPAPGGPSPVLGLQPLRGRSAR